MKISKLLPITLAFMLCTSTVTFAEETPVTATYTLDLKEYLKITATDPGSTTVKTYDDDYEGVNLTTALAGTFTIITNNPAKTVYLQGSAAVSGGGTANALFSEDATDPTKLVLVFTNTTANYIPSSTAVTSITGGTTDLAESPNAIAFRLTPSDTVTDLSGDAATATWDSTKNQVKYVISNGTTDFTYTLAQTAYPNTFSTHDTMGNYQATLTMTENSL